MFLALMVGDSFTSMVTYIKYFMCQSYFSKVVLRKKFYRWIVVIVSQDVYVFFCFFSVFIGV